MGSLQTFVPVGGRPRVWILGSLATLLAACASAPPKVGRPSAPTLSSNESPVPARSQATSPSEAAALDLVFAGGPVPHLPLPPLAPQPRSRPGKAPARIAIHAIEPNDWRGSAQLFLHLAEVSKTRYLLDLDADLPREAASSVLGPLLPWPAQRRLNPKVFTTQAGTPVVTEGLPNSAASALLVEARLATRLGHPEAAHARFIEITKRDPDFAFAWTARAEGELARGDLQAASDSLRRSGGAQSLDPYAHALTAELTLAKSGDPKEQRPPTAVNFAKARVRARAELGRALSLYPGYPPAAGLIHLITGTRFSWRPFSPPARVSIGQAGELRVEVDTRRSEAWLAWALCEATTRFEADRSLLPFDDPPDGVRLRRELSCILALVDAASPSKLPRFAAHPHRAPNRDPQLRRLLRIARAGFLGEFVLYDLIAPRFPALLLHVSKLQRSRLEHYVDRFVLPAAR